MLKFTLLLLVLSFAAQARIVTTDKPFDIMLVGQGYFGVHDDQGTLEYTNEGSFLLREDGFIVDVKGRKLSPGLRLPLNSKMIEITNAGKVEVTTDKNEKTFLGTIDLFAKNELNQMIQVDAFEAPYKVELRQGMQYIP